MVLFDSQHFISIFVNSDNILCLEAPPTEESQPEDGDDDHDENDDDIEAAGLNRDCNFQSANKRAAFVSIYLC